jgi:hypothetical protein
MGKWQKAIEYGRRAVGLKYHFPVAHFYLGCAQQRDNDIDGAIHALQTALEQNPNFVEAHRRLSKIFRRLKSDDKLAKYHSSMARGLAKKNRELEKANASIELPEFDAADFQDHLPNLDLLLDDDGDFVRCIAQPVSLRSVSTGSPIPEVVIVSGMPRSGTSMMMQMLMAGGMVPLTDSQRTADESNPKGYFEAEIVKQLGKKNRWVRECGGKVIKVVAPLIPFLPQGVNYKVIFMLRDIGEILDSQAEMLKRLGREQGQVDRQRLGQVFKNQIHFAIQYLAVYRHRVLKTPYRDVINDPRIAAHQIRDFLGQELDVDAMAASVDPSLHRQKIRN